MSAILDSFGNPFRRMGTDQAYDGASLTLPDLAAWVPGSWTADQALAGEKRPLVARVEDMVRNNGIASSAIRTLVDNVIGKGMVMQAWPDWQALGRTAEWADAWSVNVEAHWRTFSLSKDFDVARQLDFHAATRLIYRSMMTSGDALILPMWKRGRRFQTCFKIIEASRLRTPTSKLSDQNVRNGIRYDDDGEPLTYYVLMKEPDPRLGTLDLGDGTAPDHAVATIPARTRFGRKRVLHLFEKLRPGQSSGIPVMAAALRQFRMLDRYQVSELQAAVVNAMVAAFVESSMTSEELVKLFGGTMENFLEARNEWRVKMEGGAILQMFPGDKLNPFMPQRPNAEYDAFCVSTMRNIASALNLPYELLAKDFSKVNYSSARAAMLEGWRYFNEQRAAISRDWCDEVKLLFMQEAVERGLIRAPRFWQNMEAYSRSRWIGPGRGWIDPVKEAQAADARVKAGLSTLEKEAAEQGEDWRDLLEQRRREKDEQEAAGFIVHGSKASAQFASSLEPSTPSSESGGGSGNQQDEGRSRPDEEDD